MIGHVVDHILLVNKDILELDTKSEPIKVQERKFQLT